MGKDIREYLAIRFESVDGERPIFKANNNSFGIGHCVGSIYGHGYW
jgi:hypothetical protein